MSMMSPQLFAMHLFATRDYVNSTVFALVMRIRFSKSKHSAVKHEEKSDCFYTSMEILRENKLYIKFALKKGSSFVNARPLWLASF
jgi:hypothetical protein